MPEEFHLCQPDKIGAGVPSCASCCGIYNYFGHNRELISGILRMQTGLARSWDGTDRDMERIQFEVLGKRPGPRFEVIYNCPHAGFLDREETRVGCLLHPGFAGKELRDYCRYGHRTCGEARCTAYTYFDEGEAAAVAAGAGDWYIYGLCITDIDLVKDFFELCEMKRYGPVDAARVAGDPELARAFGDYLKLKGNWPFATDPARFGKYYFVDRNYLLYSIDHRRLGSSPCFHDGILLSLGSVIETGDDLARAISLVDEKVDAFMKIYEKADVAARSG